MGKIVKNTEDSKEKKGKDAQAERIGLTEESSVIDLLAEELVRELLLNENIKEDEASQDYSAVEEALTTLLGRDPSMEQKVSPTFVETAVRLDQFLQEEEEKKHETVDKVNILLEEAIGLASGVVHLRENVEERLLIRQKPEHIRREEGLKSSQLVKLLSLLEE